MNTALNILYRDGDVVAVNKPEGIAAVPEHPHDPTCLAAQVAAALAMRVWPVHRLDKDVSGVILYALHAEAHRILNARFEQRDVHKRYRALTWGRVAADSGTIDQPLREFGSGRMGVDPAGKASVTAYTVLERLTRFTLLEAQPHTGRRHQIRAHLYSIGHPVLGDPSYGKPTKLSAKAPRLMLHASGLELPHPMATGKSLKAHSPLPADFRRCLKLFDMGK